jgi:hypothetical protein
MANFSEIRISMISFPKMAHFHGEFTIKVLFTMASMIQIHLRNIFPHALEKTTLLVNFPQRSKFP